jgi:hypothetical protein
MSFGYLDIPEVYSVRFAVGDMADGRVGTTPHPGNRALFILINTVAHAIESITSSLYCISDGDRACELEIRTRATLWRIQTTIGPTQDLEIQRLIWLRLHSH